MSYIAETYTIGGLGRKEIEVSRGSTLRISVAVPGGTTGKTFSSVFQHTSYIDSTNPPPVQGVDLAGAFTVSVLDTKTIELSTPTGTLLAGLYRYDIRSSESSSGDISLSSTREFVVLPAITNGSSAGPLPPGADAQALISQHNSDPGAHGSRSYNSTFRQSDLSTAGVLVREHGLVAPPSTVTILDNAGGIVSPSNVVLSLTAAAIDLSDFEPIDGIWQVIIAV